MGDKDEKLVDYLVEHLVRHRPELANYTMCADWRDRPDRLLLHPTHPPIGVEVTEILPIEGNQRASRSKEHAEWWDRVGDQVGKLIGQDPAGDKMFRTTIAPRGVNYIRIGSRARIAADIVALLRDNLANITDHILTVDGPMLATYPILSRAVKEIRLWRSDDLTWWNPCHHEHMCPDWFEQGLRRRLGSKSKLVKNYRSNLKGLANGQHAQLYLLVWTKNEYPSSPAAITEIGPAIRKLASELGHSGFDAVQYIQGIHNNTTGELLPPCRLYPLPTHSELDWIGYQIWP